jgi:hypothetical protein
VALASLRKYGVAGSGVALIGSVAYGVAFFTGQQSTVLLALGAVTGFGWLYVYWTLGEASKYFNGRIIIDAIVGALGISAIVRSATYLYAPQASILPTPNYGIFLRLPPASVDGAGLYFLGLAGSVISGWLIYHGLTALGKESGVSLFRTAGIVVLGGSFLTVVLGSMATDLMLVPLVFGFSRIVKVTRVEAKDGVVAKSRWKWNKDFWFTGSGIVEVFTLYEDVFLLAIYLGLGLSFVFEFALEFAGYPQYTDLYPYQNAFASTLGSAVGVIVALVLSRWKLPEFSDEILLSRSQAKIDWKDVKSVSKTSLRRLRVETQDESYTASMPDDKDAFLKFVASKIGNRLNIARQ